MTAKRGTRKQTGKQYPHPGEGRHRLTSHGNGNRAPDTVRDFIGLMLAISIDAAGGGSPKTLSGWPGIE
eukprot:2590275-Pyramimonas_sp.AAC.1